MKPHDESTHPSAGAALYALEMKQGLVQDRGIVAGNRVEGLDKGGQGQAVGASGRADRSCYRRRYGPEIEGPSTTTGQQLFRRNPFGDGSSGKSSKADFTDNEPAAQIK